MLTNYAFDKMTLKILIFLRFSFIFFFRRSLITISNDFILYIDNIRLAKIIIFTISNFLRIAVYEARHYSNVNENCKNHRFIYNIILHTILKLICFHSIENISRITVWSSNHVNLVNNNVIEMNFNNLLLEILHLFLVRELDLINMSSVDFRIHSLYIKLINAYDLNRETRFCKYVNLWYVFNWCSFVWLIHENVHFQSCDDNKRQFIWCCIIKIVNDIQNHVELDEINIFKNCSRSIRNIRFENVKHHKFFDETNIMKERAELIWILKKST